MFLLTLISCYVQYVSDLKSLFGLRFTLTGLRFLTFLSVEFGLVTEVGFWMHEDHRHRNFERNQAITRSILDFYSNKDFIPILDIILIKHLGLYLDCEWNGLE